MEDHLVIKGIKILINATSWTNFEDVILNEKKKKTDPKIHVINGSICMTIQNKKLWETKSKQWLL